MMKKVFSVLMMAFAITAMVACTEKDNSTSGDNPGGGNNPGGGTAQTDTTIMNYTLMRSLIDIDWNEACNRVMAMGFTEIDPEDLDEEDSVNVRAFIKGNIMGDYYACYLRCDFPEVDNLVGGVVIHEHHMNSSSQATCVENEILFIYDEQRVLADMTRNPDCGGIIMWGDMTGSGQHENNHEYYTGAESLESFATALRALDEYASVNANWADNYLYNGSLYVAACSAVCVTQPYASIMENIISLAKEDNLD